MINNTDMCPKPPFVPFKHLSMKNSYALYGKKTDLLNVLALKIKNGWERKVVQANRYTKPFSPLKIPQNLNLWGSPQSYTVVLWLEEHDMLSLSGMV